MVTPVVVNRSTNPGATQQLIDAGTHPLLARLMAARGVENSNELASRWADMLNPNTLSQTQQAATFLAEAIEEQKRLLIIADYDCDGATACAVALRALTEMGADVDFLVPNRFETGYGLSPAIVSLALQHPNGKPDILITVDNGIASVEGVEAATSVGIDVVITDHHLPGDELPKAAAIVNPNHPNCGFLSKNLAGVGVIFYLMLALRAELRERGAFDIEDQPRLNLLSDLVALGTVADVVKLDSNNRLLVSQGLKQMRNGHMQAGIAALFEVASRNPANASTFDLGFALGPRINAAGRLADMSLGIRCLTTDDPHEARRLAQELEAMNHDRRAIEQTMRDEAMRAVETATANGATKQASLCVYHPDWHQGVVGLVASRLKEKYWRPTLAFARSDDGSLKGSGRSVPDVHLRDALDLVSKRDPQLINQFGGHAMAAGLSIAEHNYERFVELFDEAVRTLSGRDSFEPVIQTDGSLEVQYLDVSTAALLETQVWGAGFPAPLFRDTFNIQQQRLLKDKHLKLRLERNGSIIDAIWFNHNQLLGDQADISYRLDQNHWNGRVSVQLIIEYALSLS
ncbi:single-stranded-DNA-specific exonuclease RecJ [Paenalcaligenes niemegkensis]|uniref:single-stranded-DNA-specific exonuclease RecJ n=1 Tax=Paenalcaligenes niemegkensis TaxID=2895469 RepID=UPI001EE7F12C|nr:single-stranded-DNA-specific exonuclease RecJ [Paenalcaligenes niemegkensis]MCQ9616570.1 single-stranded-DNA-specific exonuclease RecJ [Paenalcaligenes niemegkensis]